MFVQNKEIPAYNAVCFKELDRYLAISAYLLLFSLKFSNTLSSFIDLMSLASSNASRSRCNFWAASVINRKMY